MTLTEFLLARIAEDEAARDRGRDSTGAPRAESDGWEWVKRSKAECEAKRRIVKLHGGDYDAECQSPAHLDGPCRTLRALAAVYADHPDYDETWRP